MIVFPAQIILSLSIQKLLPAIRPPLQLASFLNERYRPAYFYAYASSLITVTGMLLQPSVLRVAAETAIEELGCELMMIPEATPVMIGCILANSGTAPTNEQ
jgi:hypothetical protein